MIRYTVVWHRRAHEQLAKMWLQADDRSVISRSADAVDQLLAVDATRVGIKVGGRLRQVNVRPLRILFSVSEADRMVRVLFVANP